MKLDRAKHDQDIIISWLGTNASGDYIKDLMKPKVTHAVKPKRIEDDPNAKKQEWMRLAKAFGGL